MKNNESIRFLLGHDADRDKLRITPPGKGAALPFKVANAEMVQELLTC